MRDNITTKYQNWQHIPWDEVNERVRDLQDRIVKATLDNNMRIVYQLQNQLVTSVQPLHQLCHISITHANKKVDEAKIN